LLSIHKISETDGPSAKKQDKKPRYRKDDRAMRPIYEWPENCM